MAALTNELIPAFTQIRDSHRSETDGWRLEHRKHRITLSRSPQAEPVVKLKKAEFSDR